MLQMLQTTGQEFSATLPQNTPIVSTRKVAEPKHSLVPSSEVFDEEINEITQVHCENKVFKF